MKKLVLVAVLTTSFAAAAQSPAPDKTTPAAAPAPAKDKAAPAAPATAPAAPLVMTAEGKKFIESSLGNWTMKDATLSMGSQQMKGKFSMECEKAAGGWAALCKGKQDFGKDMKAEGVYLMAWDVVAGEGHMFEVESMGNVHNHVGKWVDDKSITLVHVGKNAQGVEETDTVTLTWVSPKEIVFKANGKSGATVNWTFVGTMKK